VHIPRGFGVLVPRGESIRMLGCLWDSQIFEGRAPTNSVLVRAMLGGAVDPEAGALSEADAVACVREDIDRLLGVTAVPCFRHVVRWPAAIPQYELGHAERVAVVERETAALPSLFVAGNALHGVAFAKAATCGWARGSEAARTALADTDLGTATRASA
jgi:oxygen-dependent protoporphyrinogen oxidase